MLVSAGSAAGLAIAIAASRLLPHYIVGLSAVRPAILLACTFGMFLIAAAAVSIPAIRGSRVEPLSALRHE